ncbi:BRCA2, oligonucleotide/oligosaccharide-binding, domain 1-domain-containing protein [Cantharellus anzutake]|uniref:BRCA2, oligonucleotide/oligosaccharide-binding, domain 1-domain-containing protein n=1 Tax=Cantharellus anzutake TaxID=1750568 RepID=UPI001903F569|nr:BRCA2, oligonucleotide/oligosaccharide-binding, domain 1-domain-containing protein [Cantharellus anzutake]KAF8333072.1 BRCA2, oligonucleotide/oligosaccharide-binding, domain 1-domain-containing protein [Cantharellus anzutake]
MWGDVTEPDLAFFEALEAPSTPSGNRPTKSLPEPDPDGPAIPAFRTGRLRPLEYDAETAAKARKILEDISAEVEGTNVDSSSLPSSSQSFSHLRKSLPEFKTPFKTSRIPDSVIAMSQACPKEWQGLQSEPAISSTPSASSTALPPPTLSTPQRSKELSAYEPSRHYTPLTRLPASHLTPNAKPSPHLGGYRARPSTATFVTPFKPGFGPGEPGRAQLTLKPPSSRRSSSPHVEVLPNFQLQPVAKGNQQATPLQSSSLNRERRTLRDIIPAPGRYTLRELLTQGIPKEIPQISPDNAAYYCFHDNQDLGDSSEHHLQPKLLGPQEALSHLVGRGCSHATQPWVECHWSLILWKKASMICCQPRLFDSMWNFESVCKDLLHHYKRDLNGTTRPLVRMIQERDAPPSRPMVLCVSGISWTPERWDENKNLVQAHPELELTDGWYKIRAEVDEVLARAARRRKIRLGTKIFICGARLQSQGEPHEVLKSYSSSRMRISGNATRLARWDSKLGLQPRALQIATFRSLNPDGGLVPLIDIIIERIYPVGFYEMDSDGVMLPAHDSAEEAEAQAKWEDARADQSSKIRSDLERRWFALEKVAEQASHAAYGWEPKPDEEEPSMLDDIFDELEEATDMNALYRNMHLSAQEYGWLSLHIARNIQEQKENLPQLIEKELECSLPCRNVRNFRIIKAKDARNGRRKASRTAQITVWDVLGLGEGFLEEGGRYLVNNLYPGQLGAWGSLNEGEVFLNSRLGTRWTRLRGNTD